MKTIRFRVTAAAAGMFLVVLGLVAAIVVIVQWRTMVGSIDRSLRLSASELTRQLADDAADIDKILAGSTDSLNPDDHFAVVQAGGRADGKVTASTENLAAVRTDFPLMEPQAPGQRVFQTRQDIPLDDDRYRVVVTGLAAGSVGPEPAVLVVGENIDDVYDAAVSLTVLLGVAVPFVTVVFALVVWNLVGRTLDPVERIRRRVDGIGSRQRGTRVPVPDTDDEIAHLAQTMNSMLDRVEAANARQERFVGDASHELRAPLTRMRTNLEVDLAGGGDLRPAAETTLEQVARMQSLVDDLLLLARLDHGLDRARWLPVDLDVVVDDVVTDIRSNGHRPGGIPIDLTKVSAAEVRGHRRHLARIVDNLVTNARRHARSTVAVTLTEEAGEAVLHVDDDGPGVAPEAREAIFDRFRRSDDARHHADGGTGLGLAIARELVVHHGGSISCLESPLGGARFQVELPLAEPEPRPLQ